MLFDDKLSDIIRTLESDGVLLHPSDSVWSLACSLHSKIGIEKIYQITKRDKTQSLSMLVDSLAMLKKYVPHVHPRIETLLHFHHKPLVVIYPNVNNLPTFLLNGTNKDQAIGIIHDPYCNQIIRLLGNPLISVTANIYGATYPKNFSEVSVNIINAVNFVSKHRREDNTKNLPSVVIEYDGEGEINVLED